MTAASGAGRSTPDDCRKLLVDTRVKNLEHLQGSNLTILTDCSTVEQALTERRKGHVLSERRILSAPVVSPDTAASTSGTSGVVWPASLPHLDIMGFVCVNDILNSFLECYARDAGEHGSMLARMRRLEEVGARFAQQQLKDLSCKGCDGDFLHSRHAGEARLLELVMYGFLEPKRRGMHEGEQQAQVVHRVALFDRGGAITSVISQSDIVRFLADNSDRLGELACTSMSDLGWDNKQPAVLLPDTQLVFMWSMTAEHFGALSLPVGEFLALEHDTEYVRAAAGWAANREVGQRLVVVRPDTTFGEVLQLLVSHRVHRVYVVNAAMQPVGIVTCTGEQLQPGASAVDLVAGGRQAGTPMPRGCHLGPFHDCDKRQPHTYRKDSSTLLPRRNLYSPTGSTMSSLYHT
eukprot:XP_001701393.1 predicted protein [Chlamydomonas reinhardtii]